MTSKAPEKRMCDKVFIRKRKRSSFASEDSEFVLPGLRRDQLPKHRSCMVHLLAYKHGQQATRKQAQEIEDEYATSTSSVPIPFIAPDMSSSPVPFQATNTSTDPVPSQAINMSSRSFGDHLERIWRSFPADKLVNFTYLECLWFEMYRKTSHRTKVLSWIKRKNIFSRNYVFVPICCWSHWNILILCHFSESFDSENKKPCMLLLDSLHMADPTRLERDIRKFVLDTYKEKGISDRRVSNIPLLVPKVPQQRNKECGFFSLYFIKKFMEAAPETISDDDMSFMDKNWFTREELDGFCIALEEESKAQREQEAKTSQEMVHESSEGDVIVIHD